MQTETMTSAEIEAAVDSLLSDVTIDYSAVLIGKRDKDYKWAHDLWSISFYRRTKGQESRFEFKTGIGLRSKKNGSPVKPTAASVLSCLVRDAAARDQSFADWCADYGYDDDSIKVLNLYKECCETHTKLLKVFKHDEIARIEELTQDY